MLCVQTDFWWFLTIKRAGMTEKLTSLMSRVVGVSLVALALAQPVQAKDAKQDGVATPKKSSVLGLASAERIEAQSAAEFAKLKQQTAAQKALAPDDYPQLIRIRAIAEKLIPYAIQFSERYVNSSNPVNRAKEWKWEVILIGSKQVNAFCMPGGKIAFYTGIIESLQMTDDEIAMVMGHEIAHAIMEHGRERAAKGTGAQVLTVGASVLSQVFGFGNLGGQLASGVAQVTMLKYGRSDETEADMVGLDIAARAGYDPRAGMVLWEKMSAVSKGAPPQWMSTHPSHSSRIKEIEAHLPETLPLYARARNRDVYSLPPYETTWKGKAR